VSWGGTFALAGWAVASVGFTAYVRLFGSYERLYGALGAVVAFLVWLWMGNLAFVLGIEANVWLEERKATALGASLPGDAWQPPSASGSTVPETAETAEPGVEVPGGGR
jgi:membrane protein